MTVDSKQLLQLINDFRRVSTPKAFSNAIKKSLNKIARDAVTHIVKTQLSGSLGPSFTGNPHKQAKRRRSGTLARSIEGRVISVGTSPAIQVGILKGPALSYAAIQEYGTTGYNPDSPFDRIEPDGKFLTVPISRSAKRAGSPRNDGRKLRPVYFREPSGFWGNVAGMLVLQQDQKRRNARVTRGRRNLKAEYLLLTFVEIRPGLFLTDGFQDFIPQILDKLAETLTQLVEGKDVKA